jgi:hypothetical protein
MVPLSFSHYLKNEDYNKIKNLTKNKKILFILFS